MDNLLELALDFQAQATMAHYQEFFGDEDAGEWMYFCKKTSVLKMYEIMDERNRKAFVSYLESRFTTLELPDVEWVPMGIPEVRW